MKPVKFKHQNIVFAENQSEYQKLPALKIDSEEGEVISCWKLSFKERIKVLIFGRVWLSLLSFNKPLTPSFLAVDRKEVYSHPDDFVKGMAELRKRINIGYRLKKGFVRFVSFLFYEKGTNLGHRCSGWGVYPSGEKCCGCSDCADKHWNNKRKSK